MIDIEKIVDECIVLLQSPDIDIFGFGGIANRYSLGKGSLKKLRILVYKKIDRETLHSMLRSKQAKYRNRIRNSKPIKYSDESKRRMSNSINKFWNSIKGTVREEELKGISRQSLQKMVASGATQTEHAKAARVTTRKNNGAPWHSDETKTKMANANIGQVRTAETKHNMSVAASAKFASGWRRQGFTHSIETRKHLSDTTTNAWISGLYSGDRLYTSKSEKDVRRIILEVMGRPINLTNTVRWGKSWDIVNDIDKYIIEFNGTYWHFDPAIYTSDYYCTSRKITAQSVWLKDNQKLRIAQHHGYRFIRIWELDWKRLLNDTEKTNFIKTILKNNNII